MARSRIHAAVIAACLILLFSSQVFAQSAQDRGLSGEDIRKTISGRHPQRRPRPPVPFTSEPQHPGRAPSVVERSVEVELLEEAGLDRSGEPVRFGFPLPKGVLFDPSHIRLLTPDGVEWPAQFTITSFWEDGSIRWLLVTFLADVKANSKTVYTVEFGSDVNRRAHARSVIYRKSGSIIMVDTGPMRLSINTRNFSPFDKVWLDYNDDGRFSDDDLIALGGGITMGVGGEEFSSGDVNFVVEEEGHTALTLRFEGPYSSDGKDFFRHITRLRFFAGSAIVGISHTHIDDHLEREFADFSFVEMPIRLAKKPSDAGFLLTNSEGNLVWRLGPPGLRLFHQDDGLFTVSGGDLNIAGRRTPGIADVRWTGGNISAAVEDFWQNYPSGIKTSDDGIVIELWPRISEIDYSYLPEHVRFPFVDEGYRFKWGMSRTQHLWLSFGGEDVSGLGAGSLIPVLPPAWYEETEALGPMAAQRRDEFSTWDEVFAKSFESHLARKERNREYGFFNWGDWHGEREFNWGNNEYDLPHALFMQFARTGDRRYFRWALAGARHQADVDCVHAYPDPALIGGNVVHGVCHTGDWSEKNPRRGWSFAYGWAAAASNGHTWAEGMCDAWYLTGDERVMETAQNLGEHVAYGMAPEFQRLGTHERSAGWALKAVTTLYKATLDPLYLEAARKIADVALREQDLNGTGVWPHPLPGGHCLHSEGERCVGNAVFLIGVLCSGIKDYHLVTNDPRARQSLISAAPWFKNLWDEANSGFPYTSCSLFAGRGSAIYGMMCSDALVYMHELTGDEEYLRMAAESLMGALSRPPGGGGKELAQFTRDAPRILAALRAHSAKSLEARKAVTLKPEDFIKQAAAKAKAPTFFGIRSPEIKRFHALTSGRTVLRIERKTHGAMIKREPTGTVTISADGKIIRRAEFDTDKPFDLEVPVPTGLSLIEISDDMRGIWNVSGKAKVALECPGQITLANYRNHRLYFHVPSGTPAFTLAVTAVHPGPYSVVVFDSRGNVRGSAMGDNPEMGSPMGKASVSVNTSGYSGMYSVVISGGGDMALWLEGVHPYLSLSEQDWFDPERQN